MAIDRESQNEKLVVDLFRSVESRVEDEHDPEGYESFLGFVGGVRCEIRVGIRIVANESMQLETTVAYFKHPPDEDGPQEADASTYTNSPAVPLAMCDWDTVARYRQCLAECLEKLLSQTEVEWHPEPNFATAFEKAAIDAAANPTKSSGEGPKRL